MITDMVNSGRIFLFFNRDKFMFRSIMDEVRVGNATGLNKNG